MSSPDPQFDPKNVRVADYKFAPRKDISTKEFKSEMKGIRGGLQKVVGHKRRERHEKAKLMAKKMKNHPHKYDVGQNKRGTDEYDDRQV